MNNNFSNNLLFADKPYYLITTRKERISFIYVERAKIKEENFSLIAIKGRKQYSLPSGKINAIFLGPGVSITTSAINLMTSLGTTIITVSEGISKTHACYTGIVKSSQNLVKQAAVVSNNKKRFEMAKKMFIMRWGENYDENFYNNKTIRNLEQLEGQRVKKIYKENSEKYNIIFKRETKIENPISQNDKINKTLDQLNHILYGICNGVILGLGFSPGLGIIHHGHMNAFTFDLADFFKDNLTIPTSFIIYDKTDTEKREYFTELLFKEKIMEKTVSILQELFGEMEYLQRDESGLYNKNGIEWNVKNKNNISSIIKNDQG